MPGTQENHLDLVPPLAAAGNVAAFTQSGQTIGASFSPANTSFALFVTNTVEQLLSHVALSLNG